METERKTCQNCGKEFTIGPEDFKFYEKVKVPPPTFCFDCRLQRKLAFINERTLFKRTCDKCRKPIVSMYSDKSGHTVFCTSCYNDRGDCREYGMDYDFSKTFFEQFQVLYKKVPKLHLMHKNNNGEKCEYANYTYRSRDVYLSFAVVRSEDIYYSKQVSEGNKICIDSDTLHLNERGYELIGTSRSYNSRFLVRSSQCINSAFLFNCLNCTNCFMSSNLRNKSYIFRNQQLSREEYLEAMKDFPLDSYAIQAKCKKEFGELCRHTICRFSNMKKAVDCTGDFMGNSKNTKYSFCNIDSENSKYIVFGVNWVRECYDMVFAGKSELCYEVAGGGSINNNAILSIDVGTNNNIAYCSSVNNCKDCFGCSGLTNKQYCILNKQYTKEEYEKLLPEIRKSMDFIPYVDKRKRIYTYGEFFPAELSPFSYNESLAYEEFPLSKEEVGREGYYWRDPEDKHYDTTMEAHQLPDSILDIPDTITSAVIACPNKGQVETKCTFGYKIMPDELRFYRLMNIPLPRLCPNCRYYERREWKNPWKLWHRKCMNKGCNNEFETSYAPDRPEIVYCATCYQKEVY